MSRASTPGLFFSANLFRAHMDCYLFCFPSNRRIAGSRQPGDFLVNMLKSKTFVKKTRSGGVMKIVREHYLRDDIWCGSEYCTDCKQESTVLQRDACIESNLCPFPHYVILDTNVVLHQVKQKLDPINTISYSLKKKNLTKYPRI